jgi:hypothetical protein
MRFVQVVFLAVWQLTAIPFVAVLSANAVKPAATSSVAVNETVIYKMRSN